ncbi:MAG: Transposase, partial [Moorella sp. 60_41]
PKAMERLEAGFEDAMAVMVLPEPVRRRLRATNAIERLNREFRRRERVVGIFPNEEAALRLIGAVLMEIDEAWPTGQLQGKANSYLIRELSFCGVEWSVSG